VGQLAVVTFEDMAALERDGVSLFRLKEGAGGEAAPLEFEVKQGYVEQSNVQSILEMTSMIDLARDYESQQKALRTLDDIDSMATQRVGKLTA
jgi:flagellar basal-body rod protein FlgG